MLVTVKCLLNAMRLNAKCYMVNTEATHTHIHTVLTAIFPGEPGLAGCPLKSSSPFIIELHILLGKA